MLLFKPTREWYSAEGAAFAFEKSAWVTQVSGCKENELPLLPCTVDSDGREMEKTLELKKEF